MTTYNYVTKLRENEHGRRYHANHPLPYSNFEGVETVTM